MKTILYSQMIRKTVGLPNSSQKAKLVEILAERGKRGWTTKEMILETGLLGKEGKYYPTNIIKDITTEGNILVRKVSVRGKNEPSTEVYFLLSNLKGERAIGPNWQELGRAYDFEISIKSDPWLIWKVLIKPPGLSPTKRRIKVPTKDVIDIEGNNIRINTKDKG